MREKEKLNNKQKVINLAEHKFNVIYCGEPDGNTINIIHAQMAASSEKFIKRSASCKLLVSATLIELPLCASFENVCSITRKL
jgi:hypothetical protein